MMWDLRGACAVLDQKRQPSCIEEYISAYHQEDCRKRTLHKERHLRQPRLEVQHEERRSLCNALNESKDIHTGTSIMLRDIFGLDLAHIRI